MASIRRYQIGVVLIALFGISVFAYRGRTIVSNNSGGAPVKSTIVKSRKPTPTATNTSVPFSGGLDIPQFVIASGGDTSTGGTLSVSGVIGQSVTGTSTGGSFTLTSGFLNSSSPDLTVTKTNNVSGSTTIGNSWMWTLHIADANTPASFNDGQAILVDNLPDTNISYGSVSINASGVTGTVNCNIDTNDLNCVANGAVSINAGGTIDIQFTATPTTTGSFGNPRGGGLCSADPGNVVSESDETNNTCSDTVTVNPPAIVFTDPGGNCGAGNTPCFNSIQTAIDTVGSAGTVNVGGGTYPEFVNISQPITVNINGNIAIKMLIFSQCTINAGSSNISLEINWTNNGGTFNPGTGSVNFNGPGPQVIGGSVSTVFNNLTINDPFHTTSLGIDETITGLLTLTHDLDTSSFTLTMTNSSSSTGNADVIGTVKRTGFVTGSSFVSIGNQFNQFRIASGPAPSDITLKMAKSVPTDAITGFTNSGFPNAVKRTYVITPSSTGFTAVFALHYLPSELNGNVEGPSLGLWRFNSSTGHWENQGEDGFSPSNHLVLKAGVTQFSPWTFASVVPTEATLEKFTAITESNQTLLQWQTGFEVNNLGFNIYRQQNAERVKINPSLIAGSALMVGSDIRVEAGNSYTWLDDIVNSNATYWLEDVDLSGNSTWHGPFGVTASSSNMTALKRANSVMLDQFNAAKIINNPNLGVIQRSFPANFSSNGGVTVARNTAGVTSGRTPVKPSSIPPTLLKQWSIAGQSAIKIAVNQTGWYHVNMADLMTAGLNTGANPQTLQMFVGGAEIPIVVNTNKPGLLSADDSIEFFGAGLDMPTSDTQIYWLVAGSQVGKRIATRQSPGKTNSTGPTSFAYTVERKDRTLYFSSLRNGDAENWFGPVITTLPASQTLTVDHLDTGSSEMATVEIALQGVSTNAHQINGTLNRTAIESVAFNAMDHKNVFVTIPQSSLIEGNNQINLVAQNSGDISLVDYVRITYAHTYTADNNNLFVSVPGMQPVQVTGFTSNQIRAIDVENPNQPEQVEGTIGGDAGNYTISFAPAKQRNLLVFTPDQMLKPLSISANQSSTLNKGGNSNFVIITQKDFAQSVQPFVAYKQAEGYQVTIIDVEDIYDEFSYGVHTPHAVKDFLNWTYLHWSKQPQYVLLAGSASLDPRNYSGLGYQDFVPTKLIDTASMETASDDWLVDFDNDGKPQMSIGRLPVRTADEATAVVNKIIGYEQSGKTQSVVLVSDVSDNADFNTPNNQIKSMAPSDLNVVSIIRGQTNTDAKTELMDQLSQGGKIVNYQGHGSVNLWRGNLLTNSDVATLANHKPSPLVVTMTCLNGYFQDPHLASLGESLIKVNQGGAVAVWSSSAMTDAGNQVALNQAFFKQLFGNQNVTIGQAIRAAKSSTDDNDVRRTWILFGDPTMRIK